MPPITITEKDFAVLAHAARDAHKVGDASQAEALDKLARMANAALSVQSVPHRFTAHRVRWQDMPSTLEP